MYTLMSGGPIEYNMYICMCVCIYSLCMDILMYVRYLFISFLYTMHACMYVYMNVCLYHVSTLCICMYGVLYYIWCTIVYIGDALY